jgi:hypothetical protein
VANDWGTTLRQAHRPEQALDAFSRAARYTARDWSGATAADSGAAETSAEQDAAPA